ncbi:NIPSNAP family protein [Hwanghaeella sp.]|uniref:NIPSNAP family protein n=1 Tax=Hwanghaeella sp. TaxID=2605943 RepID=UPI003CCBB36F
MIIDHRTYICHPGKLNDFLAVYQAKGLPVQLRHLGKMVGWYSSMDIGPLNQVVHMWAYKDLTDRAERRAKMAADPEWGPYLAEATPFLFSMENKILSPTSFFDLDAMAEKAPYNK